MDIINAINDLTVNKSHIARLAEMPLRDLNNVAECTKNQPFSKVILARAGYYQGKKCKISKEILDKIYCPGEFIGTDMAIMDGIIYINLSPRLKEIAIKLNRFGFYRDYRGNPYDESCYEDDDVLYMLHMGKYEKLQVAGITIIRNSYWSDVSENSLAEIYENGSDFQKTIVALQTYTGGIIARIFDNPELAERFPNIAARINKIE